MSSIEKVIVDVILSAKKYVKTFIALLFSRMKVFNSLDPDFQSSEQYFSPLAFFVIATFISFIMMVDSHNNILHFSDISSIAKMLPSFAHNMSFLDFLIDTTPIILVCYGIAILMSKVLFIPPKWKNAYINYSFYCFAVAQLLTFISLLIILFLEKIELPIKPKNPKQDSMLYDILDFTKILMYLLPYLIALCLPLFPIIKRFAKQVSLLLKFLTVPVLIPFFYIFSSYTNDAMASYRELANPKEDIEYSFPTPLPDTRHFKIEYKEHNDSAFLSFEIIYYNPTKSIFYLPHEVGFGYQFKSKPNYTHWLGFEGVPNNDTDKYSQLLKPGDIIPIKYTTGVSKAKMLQLLRFEKDTSNNIGVNFNYYNFKGENLYKGGLYKPLFYPKIDQDSLVKILLILQDTLIKRHLYKSEPDTNY